MILFYSNFCNHCSMLLEHIKRYDTDKIIKLVCVDSLRSQNIKLDSKIHSVPALVLIPSKEVLFGKSVFDHLLLPPRGALCGGQSTRNDKNTKKENALDAPDSSVNNPTLEVRNNDEPSAFSLGGFKMSDNFSNIDDTIESIIDKNYNWDIISGDNITTYQGSITDINKPMNSLDLSAQAHSPQSLQSHQSQQLPQSSQSIINNKQEKRNTLPSIEELMQQRDRDIMLK